MTTSPRLTDPQTRLLERVRERGSVVLNGRARRTVEALENAGLVDVHWEIRLRIKGYATEATEKITVTPRSTP